MFYRKTGIIGLLASSIVTGAAAQLKNFVQISPGDTGADIVRKAAQVVPSERQLRWQQLELTAFFHFGINTFTNREWGNGKEDISLFHPAQLDAGQWVKTMKEAGFKQVIITAKHHDGFCLWPSRYTEHSVKNTPYKNGKGDVVKEVAEACKQYGLGFGVYLSPWDRNSPYYGDSLRYNTYFMNQLTELLTQYGKVDEVWFDGANGEGPNGKKQVYDFNSWYRLIRRLQPQAVIAVMGPDVRWVGTESGVGRETEWSVLPIDAQSQEKIAASSQKDMMVVPGVLGKYDEEDLGGRDKIMHAKGLVWYPAETDVSIRPGWFYHPAEDSKVKTPAQLLETYFTSAGRNGVLLLNVPPDTRGLISNSDINSLRGFARLREATFAHNLARGAAIHSANGKNTAALLDGKTNTCFTTTAADTATVIEFELPAQQTFDVLLLQENITLGQRVEAFRAEYFDGAQWQQFTAGTTIGYKRLLKFAPVTTHKLRLHILSSRLNPALAEFGLYKLAVQ
jgi:alpha-L-fucosidase